MKTYIQGSDAVYRFTESELQLLRETLNSMFWWREGYVYASNWRNLHIDGLEGRIFTRNLPVSSGKQIQFFTYKEADASLV